MSAMIEPRRKYRRRRERALVRRVRHLTRTPTVAAWWFGYFVRPAGARARRAVLRLRALLCDRAPVIDASPAALPREHRLRVSKWDWRILR